MKRDLVNIAAVLTLVVVASPVFWLAIAALIGRRT